MAKTVIVIPTYNEKENIPPLLNSIFLVNPQFEVLFTDDNSPDGTAELIRNLMQGNPKIHLLLRDRKEGLGRAYVAGFRAALAMKPDFIVQMDADLSHNPRYIPLMLEKAKKYDVVIGSRFVTGGGFLGVGRFRLIISCAGAFLCRLIVGIRIRDGFGGFKCFNTRVIGALDLERIRSKGFIFQLEMNYLVEKKGFSCLEMPITFYRRNSGESKFSLSGIWETVHLIWKLKNKNSVVSHGAENIRKNIDFLTQ